MILKYRNAFNAVIICLYKMYSRAGPLRKCEFLLHREFSRECSHALWCQPYLADRVSEICYPRLRWQSKNPVNILNIRKPKAIVVPGSSHPLLRELTCKRTIRRVRCRYCMPQ